jgi:hypothetical protein
MDVLASRSGTSTEPKHVAYVLQCGLLQLHVLLLLPLPFMLTDFCSSAVPAVCCLCVDQVCFKQNIHGRSLADIKAMAKAWEAAPPNYTLATADSLFKEEGERSSSSSSGSCPCLKQPVAMACACACSFACLQAGH